MLLLFRLCFENCWKIIILLKNCLLGFFGKMAQGEKCPHVSVSLNFQNPVGTIAHIGSPFAPMVRMKMEAGEFLETQGSTAWALKADN